MNKKNPFNNLPTVASLRTETGIEQFRKNIKEEELTEKDSYMLQIKFLIYIKLIFHLWNLNDYKNFKRMFLNINNEKIQIIGPSVIKCLESSEFTIYEELERFSKETWWYPPKNNVENNLTYETKLSDCYYIIDNLEKYMKQFFTTYATNLVQDSQEQDIDVQEEFNIRFEQEFGYLMEYSLFKDIYLNLKKASVTKLDKYIYRTKNQVEAKKNNEKRMSVSQYAKNIAKGQRDHYKRKIRNGDIVFQKPKN